MNSYAWNRFYEDAVLETDNRKLQERVNAARAAIDARLDELSRDGRDAGDERITIGDALDGLRILQQERQRENQPASVSRRGMLSRRK